VDSEIAEWLTDKLPANRERNLIDGEEVLDDVDIAPMKFASSLRKRKVKVRKRKKKKKKDLDNLFIPKVPLTRI
jgi:hypothetical protein